MRVQLALNVSDLDESIAFYTQMFGTPPAKVEPGYANFAVDEPPLKLVLFEGADQGGTINHLGVEVESVEEVHAADERMLRSGLETTGVADSDCCYAAKTESWIEGPDGARWEWYVKNADLETADGAETACCAAPAPAVTEAGSTHAVTAQSGSCC